MPPEVVAGKASDTRADIYSFGAMLYEACAGRRPFTGQIDRRDFREDQIGASPFHQGIEILGSLTPWLLSLKERWDASSTNGYAHMSYVLEDIRRMRQGKKPIGPNRTSRPENAQQSDESVFAPEEQRERRNRWRPEDEEGIVLGRRPRRSSLEKATACLS